MSLTFQQAIMCLEQFWGERGCLIWQPYSEKLGAGTGNPATVLRVLGPEPWNVGYVEPCFRPPDGRYGENPNRMQLFYQYQVILKPDPGNPQELYLESLEALGLNRREHDIRFVEDNWEAPALGAWGLGWEVWCDGQEITQFTYFQQAGGFSLDPVSVEMTYGLERLMIPIQGVRSVWDINWDGTHTYGEILRLSEVEYCRYNFDHANVDRLKTMYDLFEAEARALIAAGLVIPAHDYVLRCSHTFNLLDSRGAIGVTERAHYFARMRDLAREISVAYVAQREEMGHPWLKVVPGLKVEGSKVEKVREPLMEPATFLLEVGTEELPAGDLDDALAQLRDAVPGLLADLRLAHGRIRVLGTPRRLAVLVQDVAPRQTDIEGMVKGPPAQVAFQDGRPTRAAEGFARKQGVAVDALQRREMDAGEYVIAIKVEPGRPADEVLAERLADLIAGIRFDRSMRWNESGVAFSRPIRWLVALLGDQVVPFDYAGLVSGRVTRGLRPLHSPEIEIQRASDYLRLMADDQILVDPVERRSSILARINALAAEVGGVIPNDPGLLSEVINLVEQPTALRGTFDEAYLELPKDVLVTVMRKHQRYFPLVDGDGSLMPYFIAVRNGDDRHLDEVRHGNEEVLRARFADAAFFYEADTSKPLESFLSRLDTLTFQEKLGSVGDKVRRLEKLVGPIGEMLGLSPEEVATAARAVHLAKADLATQMVVELTSLQGVMGGHYALLGGESSAVAAAIREHYLPRFSGDVLAETTPGAAVGLADRLDSLAGLFAIGLKPTGAADPFGLRRAALGVVQTLIGREIRFDLRAGLRAAAELLPASVAEESLSETLDFIVGRLRVVLRELGHRYDVVDAVLAERGHDPCLAAQTVADLGAWVARDDWMDLLNAYSRCVRIVRDQPQIYDLDPSAFVEAATRDLYTAYKQVAARVGPQGSPTDLFTVLQPVIPTINRFFDDVLVMADDRVLRENRLALLQRIAALTAGIADLQVLEGF
ncbi:MAG: glycine--tRNA ligase subunit beta [Anaerolineae bacterium]|nr:MAG: glycine--tRNA ligase subunit beta [Anaerolineae bacterium]